VVDGGVDRLRDLAVERRDGNNPLACGGDELGRVQRLVLEVMEETAACKPGLRQADGVVLGVDLPLQGAALDLCEPVEPLLDGLLDGPPAVLPVALSFPAVTVRFFAFGLFGLDATLVLAL